MSTVDPVEFEKLKNEVAELRAALDSVLRLKRDDAGKIIHKTLTCHDLHTQNLNILDKAHAVRAYIGVNDHGPYLIFRGDDEKKRLQLRVYDNSGEIKITGNDTKDTVQILTDDEGHGNLFVHSPGGIPRAGIKGMTDGGVISVCAPDGSPRAVMHSSDGKGEIAILNPELHLIAQMSTASEGGTIGIRDHDGVRAIVLIPAATGNALMIYHGEQEEPGISLVASAKGNMVFLGNEAEDRGGTGVSLLAFPNGSGNIRVGSGKKSVAVELGIDKEGGVIEISAHEQRNLIELKIEDNGGKLSLKNGEFGGTGVFSATKAGPILLTTKEEYTASLQSTDIGGSLLISHGENIQAILGTTDDRKQTVFLLTNPDNTPSIQFAATENGGVGQICSKDGTTQVGFTCDDGGGRLSILSELGIERATLQSKLDGGGLKLKWGGTNALIAAATEVGGAVVAYDAEGKTHASLPAMDGLDQSEWNQDED